MARQETLGFPELSSLPYSLEAEQSVLGGLLLDSDVFPTVLEYITRPEMFYKKQHQALFSVLINMFNVNKTIDFVTVLNEASQANIFDSTESAKVYLVQLMEMVPTVKNIGDYCEIVKEQYYLRALMLTCSEINEKAKAGDTDAKQLLDFAEQRIYDIRQGKEIGSLVKIDSVIIETYDRLMKMTGEEKDKYAGLSTGFKRLDAVMSGLNRSDLILVAARPGMGKSSFALNIAVNVAKRYKDKDVAIFSLEMSNEQLVSRVLSSEGRIVSQKMREGNLNPEEWVQLAACSDILSKTNIYFDDTPNITVAEMKGKVRRLKNLGLIVIDYLQLMETGGNDNNRVQEIAKITRGLKIMAKELDVPVILLSQLSRAAEQRQGHKPMLSDLRDSGSIEQDADIVLFLYREDYYADGNVEENQNAAQCIVAKNRHGSTGDIDLSWVGEFTRFEDLEFYREE